MLVRIQTVSEYFSFFLSPFLTRVACEKDKGCDFGVRSNHPSFVLQTKDYFARDESCCQIYSEVSIIIRRADRGGWGCTVQLTSTGLARVYNVCSHMRSRCLHSFLQSSNSLFEYILRNLLCSQDDLIVRLGETQRRHSWVFSLRH
jgi:hypothetical protein